MFGLLKVLFYTVVAIAVGVFLGTVPVGGRTIAERLTATSHPKPSKPPAASGPRPPRVEPASAHPVGRKASRGPTAVAEAPATAGAANAPDGPSADDKRALDRLIAARAKPR